MGVIYILIPVAIILSAIGIYLFFWAVKTEQFDDLEKQGMSILFDDTEHLDTNIKHETKSTPPKVSESQESESSSSNKITSNNA